MKILKSGRLKLAFWSALISAAVVLLFGLAALFILYLELVDAVDDDLEGFGKDLLEELRKEDRIDREDLIDLFALFDETNRFHVVNLTSPQGKILFRSSDLENIAFSFRRHKSVAYQTVRSGDEFWRLAQISSHDWVLIIGTDMDEIKDAFTQLAVAFSIALPTAFILSALGGLWMARKALQPVKEITRTANRITSRGLHHRIPETGSEDEFGQLTQVLNSMLRRLESSFEQAARFSADSSHELNTPLTIMQGELELALQRENMDRDEQNLFSNLLDEVQRLKTITRSLLLFSRSDAGLLSPGKETINLSEEIANLIEDAKLVGREDQLTFLEDIPRNLKMAGNPTLLRQAFYNLLNNAVKYNRPGGEVRVSLESAPSLLICTIGNTGPGIAPSNRNKIFRRFFREDTARSRRKDGFGLGLSLAREIVRAHGGEIRLEKTDFEETVFQIKLPRER